MKQLHSRKPNRLQNYDYSQNGAYFVTICAKDRAHLFAEIHVTETPAVGATAPGRPFPQICPIVKLTEIGNLVYETIQLQNKNDVSIDCFVIMPNHIHMIVVFASQAGDRGRASVIAAQSARTGDRGRSPLHQIVRNIKSFVTKKIGFSPWQRSFHDHIIRNNGEYTKVAQYIENNPYLWTDDCYYQQ